MRPRLGGSSLADWDRVAELEAIVLLASEVFTILVIHAGPHGPGLGGEIVVGVHRTADLVRVEVADGHPGFPVVGSGGLDRASGRGLLEVLTDSWGVVPNGPGKVVWFEMQA